MLVEVSECPAIRVPFCNNHARECLRDYLQRTLHDWTPVLFTNESKGLYRQMCGEGKMNGLLLFALLNVTWQRVCHGIGRH